MVELIYHLHPSFVKTIYIRKRNVHLARKTGREDSTLQSPRVSILNSAKVSARIDLSIFKVSSLACASLELLSLLLRDEPQRATARRREKACYWWTQEVPRMAPSADRRESRRQAGAQGAQGALCQLH